MKAIGMIETKGLVAAIESSDAMLKAAEVTLIDRTFVGGGLVNITVSGDVAAVKASVDAGVAAVIRLGADTLISQHVIPRPHEELKGIIVPLVPDDEPRESATKVKEQGNDEKEEKPKSDNKEKKVVQKKDEPKDTKTLAIEKTNTDKLMAEEGITALETKLNTMSVVKLRSLAREYTQLEISGREISGANKEGLIKALLEYYKKK